VTVSPPYTPEQCVGSNTLVQQRVKALLVSASLAVPTAAVSSSTVRERVHVSPLEKETETDRDGEGLGESLSPVALVDVTRDAALEVYRAVATRPSHKRQRQAPHGGRSRVRLETARVK
jgi:hypothetical protein